ncbi:MAG: C40 family peptidase [Chitinophagaceae bacterium]|nr:C40 family peptidase [Chitinophagaceae bacterium]
MEYAFVQVPAAAVRRKPRHQKEMVNQLLFGEAVQILKIKADGWVKVSSLHDEYTGWITANMLTEASREETAEESVFVTAGLLSLLTAGARQLHVPIGSSLPGFKEGKAKLGKEEFFVEGPVYNCREQQPDHVLVDKLVRPWLNAPYLWGGRTPLGVDCSGLVQVVFRQLGVRLPRDAWQQAQEGQAVRKLQDSQPGDLVFFDDREEIVHVGILLNPETVVHASGRVRIDPIDKKGIINGDNGKRTHRLKAIRRYW